MLHRRPFIYFAAPLFNERERAFNLKITSIFEEFTSVFLPQRDGALLVDMLNAGVGLTVAEKRVFEQDRQAMNVAEVLVAVLDGGHIDEGVAFEIGYMSALGKSCFGLQGDSRRALLSGNNPMISQSLQIFSDEIELIERIRLEVIRWPEQRVPA